MWGCRDKARICGVVWGSILLRTSVVGADVRNRSSGPSLRQACTNAYDYGDPTCLGNSTLYWGTGNHTDLSCAHCVCEDGWAGVDCGRCLDVSVCPSSTVDGQAAAATNCSADTLLLTEEEARSEAGKIFSCSCGGGEDGWTDFLCDQQPDTWIQWAVTGGGTEEDPAFVVLEEFAGIHARTEEKWPGQYKYHYPKIFDGSAGPCKVYRDKCFPIGGTDVGERDCVNFECGDTEGLCPPEEYPMCDGFPHCVSPKGRTYETHPCTAVPEGGKSITIACQEEKVNGSYVCYYQQPGGFAPLSMTCSVGSCLYQGGAPVQPSGSKTKAVSWSIGVQMAILVSLAGLLVMSFVLFAMVSDPGTAATAKGRAASRAKRVYGTPLLQQTPALDQEEDGITSRSGSETAELLQQQRRQQQRDGGGEWDDQNLSEPLLGRERQRRSSSSTGGGGGGEGGRRRPARPAVLRWDKLGYYVRGQGQRRGGAEMAVLKGVSGFAGPEPPPQDAAAAAATSRRSSGDGGEEVGQSTKRGVTPAGSADGGLGDETATSPPPPPPPPTACVPSTMTGILGPSGAGKSSLLDLLAGRKRRGEGRTTGSVSLAYDGTGNGSGVEAVRREGGYVSQEDVLPGTLTCYEHLMFHARLRMPPGTSFAERAERVLWVTEELGLQRVADSRIGDELERGLSGGERRRLSIATELVARPALLFADEPTTGLDAATALRVMTLLSGVASRGTTVLCSLHQPRPRVFNLLDRVILLSAGRVAYSGRPGDAEAFFRSVGRPFPRHQPHPADAMLTLVCREDGRDLPSLFRRSRLAEGAPREAAGGRAAAAAEAAEEERGKAEGGGDVSISGSLNGDGELEEETELVEVGRGGTRNGEREGRWRASRRRQRQRQQQQQQQLAPEENKKGAGDETSSAPFLVQVEALSRRLLLRAVRHPLLLVLHFGGSVAMALCLASVFEGRLGYNLAGAQDRFGILFFLLLYLALLSLTSLPVWREDRRLFLSEAMGGAYGHLPYFTSVALADILLIRVLPPLAFAVMGYPLMGLNSEPDNPGCLLWFAGILVLANVTVALAAMGIGALGLPLDLSNLIGGLMVLLLAAFGRFLLNGTRIPVAWRWLNSVTPLGYAFEALLINEFSDADGRRPYRIEGSHCSPDLPVIMPLGPQILATFSFSTERSTMHKDMLVLVSLALGLSVSSLLVFFLATRTKPLVINSYPPSGQARPSRRGNTRTGNNASTAPRRGNPVLSSDHGVTAADPAAEDMQPQPQGPMAVSTAAGIVGEEDLAPEGGQREGSAGGRGATRGGARTVSWNVPEALGGPPPPAAAAASGSRRFLSQGGWGDSFRRKRRSSSDRINARTGAEMETPPPPPPPLLLSWEGLRYEIAVPRRRGSWFGKGDAAATAAPPPPPPAGGGGGGGGARRGEEERLLVLDSVSGFAGPTRSAGGRRAVVVAAGGAAAAAAAAARTSGSVEAGRRSAVSATTVEGAPPQEGGGHGNEGGGWGGTVTAIMGPSGAGKTSLLNALAGRLQDVQREASGGGRRRRPGLTGAVRLNGLSAGPAEVRALSAYVTQEDVLPETLTCYEHLMFHAQLRLPGHTALARRHDRVVEVLEQLGLVDIRDSRIGGGLSRGISGGEKRRLSIGTELLTRPALLFLDEPTTGLDSSTAVRVMKLVSEVASLGTTVVCSVHQPRPEVVRLIHKVILLSRGAVAFCGAPSDAEAHFAAIGRPFSRLGAGETSPATDHSSSGGGGGAGGAGGAVAGGINPADAILDAIGEAEDRVDREGVDGGVESGVGLVVMPRQQLVEQVRAAEASGPPPTSLFGIHGSATTRRTPPPVCTQLSALLQRASINVARDPYLAGLHIVLTVFVGVVVGSLFRDLGRLNGCTAGVQDRLGVVFLLLLFLSLLCLTSLAAWRKQMALFVHERASGAYGAAAHLTAAAAVDALACRVLPPILLALTVSPLAGLRPGGLFGLAGGLVAFNLSLAGVLAACGAGAKSSQEALATGCLVVLFSALLSGFLVSKDDLPAAWGALAWLSPIGRGFESLVANEFSPYGAVFRLSTKIGSAPIVYTDPMTGDQILRCFGFSSGRNLTDLGILAAVGGGGLALALVFLKRSR